MNARCAALRTLCRMQASGGYSNLTLDAVLKRDDIPDPRDRALLTTLVMGVVQRQTTLDYYIDRLITPGTRLEDEVRVILRLGLYQLMYLDRIPAHAAVSETVDLAPRRAAGLVNAVLRAYLRRGAEIALPDPARDGIAAWLSVKYSFPVALCERLLCDYDAARLDAMLSAMSREPELTLRVNTLRCSREDYLGRLREALGGGVKAGTGGAAVADEAAGTAETGTAAGTGRAAGIGTAARPTPLSDAGILLPGTTVPALPGFEEGDFIVQDEASQLCVAALDARPGMRVLDICSAPGSKSFGAAMYMKNEGRITCFDLHASKLSLIERGAARLGIGIIDTAAADGRVFIPGLEGVADRVLCDAPCSGYGVMAKKPEIRHKNPADASGLPDIQFAILENCSRYVREGGVLVYSTCTVLRAENEGVRERFLAAHPEFAPEPFCLGGGGEVDAPSGDIALAPDTYGTDGFYIAKFRRQTSV